MKVVLFLGAGFSVPFGLPAMDSFLEFIDNKNCVTDDERRFVYELLIEAREANSFLESSPTNLEDILSFAIMGDRTELLDKENNLRGPRLVRILRNVYSSIRRAESLFKDVGMLTTLLGRRFFDDGHSLCVITTNYDLMIDCALHQMGKPPNLGFEYGQHGGNSGREVGNLYALGGVPVFKLHGAVNWFSMNGGSGDVRVDGRLIEIALAEKGRAVIPVACQHQYEGPGTPVIVPPTFSKSDLHPLFKSVWSGAARSLVEANLLVFVGYSFPLSDVEMRYFLARSLTGNAGIRRILLVDPKARELHERITSANSGFGSHFRRLIHPIPAKWEEVHAAGAESILNLG
jgi:hypothetical protein